MGLHPAWWSPTLCPTRAGNSVSKPQADTHTDAIFHDGFRGPHRSRLGQDCDADFLQLAAKARPGLIDLDKSRELEHPGFELDPSGIAPTKEPAALGRLTSTEFEMIVALVFAACIYSLDQTVQQKPTKILANRWPIATLKYLWGDLHLNV